MKSWLSTHLGASIAITFVIALMIGVGIGSSDDANKKSNNSANQQEAVTNAELKQSRKDLAEAKTRISQLEDKLIAGAQAKSDQSTTTNVPEPVKVKVPDLGNERLDVAEDLLVSKGLRYSEIGGGTFGIVNKSNWVVCETKPASGTSVEKRTRIKLVVARSC